MLSNGLFNILKRRNIPAFCFNHPTFFKVVAEIDLCSLDLYFPLHSEAQEAIFTSVFGQGSIKCIADVEEICFSIQFKISERTSGFRVAIFVARASLNRGL